MLFAFSNNECMRKIKIGLNGFGRIGRAITRIASDKDFFELVAINTSKNNPGTTCLLIKV
ncbi:MAG: glyceraldehyde-3-phosphate dehydrogenase [Microgenomates bacterium OLB23]|nr:MAG: glyceraldehyde-3-phosphate dehydrogenase [Microgenomates bacterium OLB23]